MEDRTILERAFDLARSGECATVADIRVGLQREGYSDVLNHLSWPSIRRQLTGLCREATQAQRESSEV